MVPDKVIWRHFCLAREYAQKVFMGIRLPSCAEELVYSLYDGSHLLLRNRAVTVHVVQLECHFNGHMDVVVSTFPSVPPNTYTEIHIREHDNCRR